MSDEPPEAVPAGNDALTPLIEAVKQLVEANMAISAALAEILRDGNLPEKLQNSAAEHLLKAVISINEAHGKALTAYAATRN